MDIVTSTPLIPIEVDENGERAVSGRALAQFLEIGSAYNVWISRMLAYGFTEGTDFQPVRIESTGGRPGLDHALTLDMAKELCMIQRSAKGRSARQYFIEVEKKFRAQQPRELSRADLARMVLEAEEDKAALEAKVIEDAPKVEYVETFVTDEDLRLLRNVAKSLGIAEGLLRQKLIERNWIYEEVSTRWSESRQEKEKVHRYSAYADKRAYFRPVPNHEAPRFRGELMHTLKVTPEGATAIARAAERWGLVAVEVAA